MEYVLTTDLLCKSYGKFKAIDGLSMHVPKGSIYGFVGKNGAGKTTLIRLICGLQYATSGEFTLYDRKSNDEAIVESRRRMGAMVETPSIYMDMTALENVEQQYRILGYSSLNGAKELLELVGLSDTGKKKAKYFSLGMRQRLGITIALAGNPEFLVLDEPVNGLDPQGIIEIRELILKLNQEKHITVLISSHILDELSRLATHYGFIDKGHIIKEMSADELDAACRKCMRYEVSDAGSFAKVLDREQAEYQIVSDTEIDLYTKMTVSSLVKLAEQENCEIITCREQDENLENFYLNLVGGGSHE